MSLTPAGELAAAELAPGAAGVGGKFLRGAAGVSRDTSGRDGSHRLPPSAPTSMLPVLIVALGATDGLRGDPSAKRAADPGQHLDVARPAGSRFALRDGRASHVRLAYTVSVHQTYVELARIYRIPLVPFRC